MAADLVERLTASLADRYRIEREVGRGGMATIILAHDLRHARDVAIKVLDPEIARSVGPDRFLREVVVAAQLQHPHILPVYDSGQADGLLYYIMPFVAGESLRSRLARERELPVDEALRILRDIVDALTEAHAHGVVHRDIKPDNVMLTGRHALVTDFGVAKALDHATGGHPHTTSGVTLGTPAYMAPEQAAADPQIDHRADIYAVGALAYEILAGRPVFVGTTPQAVLTAHVTQPPDPIERHRASLPAGLADTIMRCLAKRPADRWQTADELLHQLTGLLEPSGPIAPTHVTSTPTSTTRGKRWAVAVVATAVIAAGVFLLGRSDAPPGGTDPKIAVLPFTNASPEVTEAYFVDGVTEDVIARLTTVSGVRVVSPMSSRRYRDRDEPLRAIGDALGATFVLTGSVRQLGDNLRVVAELTEVATEDLRWARSYEQRVDDLFAIQSELAGQVVRELGTALSPQEVESVRRIPTDNLDAYRLYTQGRALWNERIEASILRSIDLFSEAISLDPGFALAHAALGDAYIILPDYSLATDEAEGDSLGLPHLERALELDPHLGEAWAGIGLTLVSALRWDEADSAFGRAIALSPGYASAYQWRGLYQVARGQIESGLAWLLTAADLNPLSPATLDNVAMAYYYRRDYDEARQWLDRKNALFGTVTHDHLILPVLLATSMNDPDLLLRWLRDWQLDDHPLSRAARDGGMIGALSWITTTEEPLLGAFRALAHANLGHRDEAFAEIEEALPRGDWLLKFLYPAPFADSLRGDPRFDALMARLGLP